MSLPLVIKEIRRLYDKVGGRMAEPNKDDVNKTKEQIGLKKIFCYLRNPYVVTIALIALGAALRIWPLNAPELRVPWLTFYPTVMAAALFGGFFAGLLGVSLACLIILFLMAGVHGTAFYPGVCWLVEHGRFLL